MQTAASRWLADETVDGAEFLATEGETHHPFGLAEKLGEVGHWWISLHDFAIKWSAGMYQILGLNPAGFTPHKDNRIRFQHPDDRGLIALAIQAAARDGTPFDLPLRLIRADGQLRHVRARGFTIAGTDNVPTHIFGVCVNITRERAAEEVLRAENLKLQQLAYVDGLTLLANRRQFDEVLSAEWLRAIREETPLSLVMLDLDRFKRFNDLYGHLAGDDCLRIVAGAVKASLRRPGDLLARYGGEEFALLLPVTDEAGALKVANAVRTVIQDLQLPPAGNKGHGGIVTASLGVSTARPQPGAETWLGLIKKADGMLYEAKRTRRNRVVSSIRFAAAGAAL